MPKRTFDHMANAALFKAVRDADVPGIGRALARNADPNAKGHKTLYGQESLFQVAALNPNAAVVRALLAAGSRQTPGRFSQTPLFAFACSYKTTPTPVLACLKSLLATHPNPWGAGRVSDTSPGKTPMEIMFAGWTNDAWPPSMQASWEEAFSLFLPSMKKHAKKADAMSVQSVAYDLVRYSTPEFLARVLAAGALPLAALGLPCTTLRHPLVSACALLESPDASDVPQADRFMAVLAAAGCPEIAGTFSPVQDAANEHYRRFQAALRSSRLDANLDPASSPRRASPRL